MALSTTLMTFFDDILLHDGVSGALRFNPGLRGAAYTFLGKAVNGDIARIARCNAVDIAIFLQFS